MVTTDTDNTTAVYVVCILLICRNLCRGWIRCVCLSGINCIVQYFRLHPEHGGPTINAIPHKSRRPKGVWRFQLFALGPLRTTLVSQRACSLPTHSRVSAHFRVLCQAGEDNGLTYMRSLAIDFEESYPSSSMSFSAKDKGKEKGFNSSLGLGWLTDKCAGNRDSKQKKDFYQVRFCVVGVHILFSTSKYFINADDVRKTFCLIYFVQATCFTRKYWRCVNVNILLLGAIHHPPSQCTR